MKSNMMYASLIALLVSGAVWSSSANAERTNLLGEAMPADAAIRTIVLGPNTAYVNVTGGDIVKFVIGDKSFAWDFDTAGDITSFDLNQVAPAGTLDHKITVYVARDPTYFGGA